MDNWRIVLTSLGEVVQNWKGRTNRIISERFRSKLNKKNHDQETPDTFNIYDLPNNFFETATK